MLDFIDINDFTGQVIGAAIEVHKALARPASPDRAKNTVLSVVSESLR